MHESAEYNELTATAYDSSMDAEAVLTDPDILSASANLAELNTEELLHKVVEAAEHNQAIEKLLELRHEVKDEPQHAKNPDTATMSRVGDILPAHPVYTLSSTQKKQYSSLTRLMSDRSMYGYAIRYGFLAAITCIIIIIIAVSVFTR